MAVILIKLIMFKQDELHGHIDLVVYNPSARVPGFITEIDPVAAKKAIEITSLAHFWSHKLQKNDPSR